MKSITNKWQLKAVTAAVAMVAGGAVFAGAPLGQILATDTITLQSGGATVSVTDTVHPLFTGDAVTTQEGASAVMRFTGDAGVVYTGAGSSATYTKDGDTFVVESTEGDLRFMFRSGVAYRILTECYVVEPAATQAVANSEWIGGSVELSDGVQSVLSAQGDLNVTLRYADGNNVKVSVDGETSVNTALCQQAAGVTVATAGAGAGLSWLMGGGATVGVAALAAEDTGSATATATTADDSTSGGGTSGGSSSSSSSSGGSSSSIAPTAPATTTTTTTDTSGSSSSSGGGNVSGSSSGSNLAGGSSGGAVTTPNDTIVIGDTSMVAPVDPKDTKVTPPVDPKDPPASPITPKK